jgi:hypothetical protein
MLEKIVAKTKNVNTGAVINLIEFAMGGSQYIVRSVDGLGPVKSAVSAMDIPAEAGGIVLGSQAGMRNIVITFEYRPNFSAGSTVSTLRRGLSKVFMPSNEVEIDFYTDLGIRRITGVVESNEPVIFAKDPQVQVSIICADPYFRNIDAQTVIDIPNTQTSFTVNFPGDVPVGYAIEATVAIADDHFTLQRLPYSIYSGMSILNLPLLVNDKLYMSSIKGDRGAVYVRSAQTINAMGYFNGSLVNEKLYPGLNYFTISNIARFSNIKIRYQILYGEV